MIVNPSGVVKIMHNVAWHSDMKNVRLFKNASEQNTYMANHTKYTLTNFTYIREQRALRVPVVADDLYNCNYLSFQNRGFGTKNFFAFITDVRYINAETSEISFELDYFQTWWFQVYLNNCLVEREHVNDDTVGLNTLDEGLDFGEMCVHNTWGRYWSEEDSNHNPNWKLAIQVKPSLAMSILGENVEAMYYGNKQFYPYTRRSDKDNISAIQDWIPLCTAAGGEIINCYMYPKEFEGVPQIPIEGLGSVYGIKRPEGFIDYADNQATPREYKPKNNKLLTFPYTKLLVVSTDGNQAEYKWERTKEGEVKFTLYHNHLNKPSCELRPTNYFRDASQRLNTVALEEFPKVQMNQYESLNLSTMFNSFGALSKGLESAVSGDVVGSIASNVSLANQLGKVATDSGKALAGTTDGCLDVKYETIGFVFYVMAIDYNHAKSIDNYFTRYGYKVNQLKVPNTTGREFFNYVKTSECLPQGDAPDEALREIGKMFDRGVTLWHIDTFVVPNNNPIVTP